MGVSGEVKSYLKNVEPMSIRMMVLINAQGVRTGSAVFGGFVEGVSDIDIIFPPAITEMLFEGCLTYKHSEYVEEHYRSFYTKDDQGVVYNLLFMQSDEEYLRWVSATAMVVESIKEGGVYTDKKRRVEVFEKLKQEAL